MERLHNPVREYAWGSRSVIAALQGRTAPSDRPEAELWIGAHPAAPSMVDRAGGAVSLAEVIAGGAPELLGAEVAAEFGPRLPYLLKVLAAQRPLSLQAHPDPAQARAGYTAEEAAGVPRDAAHRNYVDPHHKPELLVAVSEFVALCGFRDPKISAELLAPLGVAALAPVLAALREGAPNGLREAVATLLGWPPAHRRALVDEVVAACATTEPEPEYALVGRLAAEYPGDLGAVVALLLNHVVLAPGEAIWMPAGNLHAYLHGTGIEIMAASDNVLRGGLTPKHVDVDELLRVLRFDVLADPVVRPVPVLPGVVTWPAPVREFALYRALLDDGAATGPVDNRPIDTPLVGEQAIDNQLIDNQPTDDQPTDDQAINNQAIYNQAVGRPERSGPGLAAAVRRVDLDLPGPREVLCLRGQVRVDDGVAPVTLGPGEAAFGAATGRPLTCTGAGEVYLAAIAG